MKLAVKYFSDHREWFLRAALGLAVLVVLAYLPAVTRLYHPKYVIIFLCMVVSGALVVATIKTVAGYTSRKTGIMSMLTPASARSKFLLAWGVSFPGALVLTVLVVWTVNTLLHYTTGIYISNGLFFGADSPTAAQVWHASRDYLFAACLIHSVVLLGALTVTAGRGFWRRALVGIVGMGIAVTLIFGLPQWLGMPEGTSTGFPFFLEMKTSQSIDGARLWQNISWAPDGLRRVVAVVVSASIPLALWVSAWFRFKELEVR